MFAKPRSRAVLALGLLAALAAAPPALAKPGKAPRQCFRSRDWESWRAADAKTLYVRVHGREVWRMKLLACPSILSPGARIVNVVRGTDMVCRPIDLDLRVAETGGFSTPCLVKSLRPLTPDEVAALPRKQRP